MKSMWNYGEFNEEEKKYDDNWENKMDDLDYLSLVLYNQYNETDQNNLKHRIMLKRCFQLLNKLVDEKEVVINYWR